MGQNYGKLGGRRRNTGAFQWTLLGFLPGLLCGGLLIFTLVITGPLATLGPDPTPIFITEVVQIREIITTTPQDPVVVTATPGAPTSTPSTAPQSQLILPSSTPPGSITTTAQPTQAPASAQPPTSDSTTTTTTSNIPPQLASLRSPTIPIPGGEYIIGTNPQEIIEAANTCQQQGGNCPPADGQDSRPSFRAQLNAFSIEQFEVSFEQYVTFLNYLGSQGQRHTNACSGFICIQTTNENPATGVVQFDGANYLITPGLLNHPVYGVTWYGAQAYCQAIGRRLPTEAEWEAAAGGPNDTIYPWGTGFDPALANTRLPLDGAVGTRPVNEYEFGTTSTQIYNLSGNVAEWVQDWYGQTYYQTLFNQQPAVNPRGPATGVDKVLRGGSFNTFPFYTRTVHRQHYPPAPIGQQAFPNFIGFRCVEDANAATTSGGTTESATGSSFSIPADGSGITNNGNAQPSLPAPPEGQDTTPSSNRG